MEVKPDERDDPRVGVERLEHAADPARLAAALLGHADLAYLDRLAPRDPPHGGERPADLFRKGLPAIELELGAAVEQRQSDDVDVAVTRVQLCVDAVGKRDRAPHPLHVGGTGGSEQIVHVAPGVHELAAPVAVRDLRPRVPVPVHLLGEAQPNGTAGGGQRPGP